MGILIQLCYWEDKMHLLHGNSHFAHGKCSKKFAINSNSAFFTMTLSKKHHYPHFVKETLRLRDLPQITQQLNDSPGFLTLVVLGAKSWSLPTSQSFSLHRRCA